MAFLAGTLAAGLGVTGGALGTTPRSAAAGCPGWGRAAVAADPRPHALRVFAIQFEQHPDLMRTAADYATAIDCAIRTEVLPHLAPDRPNLVVFDEDVGLETVAIGPRGAAARAVLHSGDPSCQGRSLCPTLDTLSALNQGYGPALTYLHARFARLSGEPGQAFVASTDESVRVFMATMSREARRYGIYVIASDTQAPFRVDRDAAAISALADPGRLRPSAVYAPTQGVAYNQTLYGAHGPCTGAQRHR